ncbi:hypothetical protein LZ32DRAFT_351698 [Colletotrichum eremochloae]|nr:hypothetical protein LZ32DRAFT_351698 [Colletotrichum eremochloae]
MLLHRAPRCPRWRALFQGSSSLPPTGQLCLVSLSLSLTHISLGSGLRVPSTPTLLAPPVAQCPLSLLSFIPCSLHMYLTKRRSLLHPSHPPSPFFLLAPSHLLVHSPWTASRKPTGIVEANGRGAPRGQVWVRSEGVRESREA